MDKSICKIGVFYDGSLLQFWSLATATLFIWLAHW